jgi:hypothetical protein
MKQLSSEKEFYSDCCLFLQNVCLQIVRVFTCSHGCHSGWAIILHNISHLIVSCPFPSESKY